MGRTYRIILARFMVFVFSLHGIFLPGPQAYPVYAAVKEGTQNNGILNKGIQNNGSQSLYAKDNSADLKKASASDAARTASSSDAGKKAEVLPRFDEDGFLQDGDVFDDVTEAEYKVFGTLSGSLEKPDTAEKPDLEAVLLDGEIEMPLELTFQGEESEILDLSDLLEKDPDELLLKYFERELSESRMDTASGSRLRKAPRADQLTGNNALIYAYLKEEIEKIAAGEADSAELHVPLTLFGIEEATVKEEDLSLSGPLLYLDGNTLKFDQNILDEANEQLQRLVLAEDSAVVYRSLLADCPYDLYWANKKVSYPKSVGYSAGAEEIEDEPGTYQAVFTYSNDYIIYKFQVSPEYRAAESDLYTLDTEKTSAASAAAENARGIVTEAAGLSDYEKLVHYKEAICERTSYNTAAAEASAAAGNDYNGEMSPWQVIYVFDDDTTNQVVCEGYSKAFKYLCDITEFESSLIDCISPTGTMTGATGGGNHMWNLVTMEDGKNYLVDVTNCDEGTIGAPDQLFLKEYTRGSWDSTYVFTVESGSEIAYAYNTQTKELYTEEELTVSGTAYTPPSNDIYWAVTKGTSKELLISASPLSGEFDVSGSFDRDTVFSYSNLAPWSVRKTQIRKITVGSAEDVVSPGCTDHWFCDLTNVRELNIQGLDTSRVTSMVSMFENFGTSDLVLDLTELDTSNVTTMMYMFSICRAKEIDLSNIDTSKVQRMDYMFSSAYAENVDLTGISTSTVRGMSYMFSGCNSLTELDLSSFDTKALYNADHIFMGCTNLETLWINQFEMKGAISVNSVFSGCSSLKTIYGTDWKLSNWVVNQGGSYTADVFKGCTSLVGGVGTGFDASHTDAEYARIDQGSGNPGYFTRVPVPVTGVTLDQDTVTIAVGDKLTLTATLEPEDATTRGLSWSSSESSVASVDQSGKVTGLASGTSVISVLTEDGGFTAECAVTVRQPVTGITLDRKSYIMMPGETIQLNAAISPEDATEKGVSWRSSREQVAGVNETGLVTAIAAGTAVITAETFDGGLTASCTITVKPAGTFTREIFWGIRGDELLISGEPLPEGYAGGVFDGSGFIYPERRPWHAERETIKHVTVSGDTVPVKPLSLAFWFHGFSAAETIDLSGFDTSEVQDFSAMFYKCGSLLELDVSGFDTGKAVSMSTMFSHCTSLGALDLSSFDTSSVTGMSSMFSSCTALEALNLSSFDTSSVTSMSSMFSSCTALEVLDLTSFNTDKLEPLSLGSGIDDMFKDCSSLTTIYGTNWTVPLIWTGVSLFRGCTNLKGGAGTVYSSSNVNLTYARIDGGSENPGYFTKRIDPIPVTEIRITDYPQSMVEGQSALFTATVLPENADNREVEWSCSDPTLATVDADGTVHAIAGGDVEIMARAVDNSMTAGVFVHIYNKVSGISISKETLTLETGASTFLQATLTPDNLYDPFVTWESSDETVATVDQNGTVTAISAGTAVISVTARDGGFQAFCTVTVTEILVSGLLLDPEAMELTEGDSAPILVTVLPENAGKREVFWSSSDETVVTVDNGVVTAVAPGSASIHVTAADGGGAQADCAVTVRAKAIPVTGITLDKNELTIEKDASETITAMVEPSNATNKKVQWTSSDPSIAEVDENGKVTGKSAGTAFVTAETEDGGYTVSCVVTVVIPVTGIQLDITDLQLNIGQAHKLAASVLPETATDKAVTWQSSDPNAASVDTDGTVTAVGKGDAVITVTSHDGGYQAECTVKVVQPVTSVTLDQSQLTITEGDTAALHAEVKPSDASNPAVSWSSSDESVVTVDNGGVVTAIAPGSASIHVTAADGGGAYADCAVTVRAKAIPVTGVRLDKNELTIVKGAFETITATVEPSNATNKTIQWTSSDPSIAEVDENGKVTGKSAGTTFVIAEAEDGRIANSCEVTVIVPVSGVKLSVAAVTLDVGKTQKLNVTVLPADAADKSVTWKSSNSAVATVAQDGTVKAVKAGIATITVTAKDTAGGTKTATCKVTVPVPVSGVKLSPEATTLTVGKTQKLTAAVSPTNAANKAVTWKSSNTAIATVAQDGTVGAVKAGTTTITVTTKDGSKTATCKVTVPVPVSGVKLNSTATMLAVGKTQKLTATVSPINAANKAVTWKSSNTAVATVAQDGTVKAVKAGTAMIIVTTRDGGKTAKCTVTVKNANGWVGENGKKYYYTNGVAAKGWKTISGSIYYYDPKTGAMVNGEKTIDNIPCYFDPDTGIAYDGWRTISGKDYWYEKGKRRGTKFDPAGVFFEGTNRGCEIVAPGSDGKLAWFWLDAVYDGAKAVNKEVMMPYTFNGIDTTPKWVCYDEKGAMIKGWYYDSKNSKWVYYDLMTGAMTKGGPYTIDGKERYFNEVTGALIGAK